MNRISLAFLSIALLTGGSAEAQQRDSTAARGEGPPPVYSFGLAYDEGRQRLVFFGGYNRGAYNGDTWEWDGAKWARVSQTGPQGRNAPRMVYDAARKKVIMFGGDTREGALGDTWEWDGRVWTRVAGDGPTPRSLHGMVYDSDRQRTVVFSGRAGNDYRTDTWELDQGGWKKVADGGPPPRMMHAMVYDPTRRKTIVVGGSRAVAAPAEGDVLGDVWTWDGARWEQLRGSPGTRDHTAGAFDPAHDAVVIVGGGREPTGPLADAWSWRGGDQWTSVPIGALGSRAGHAMATDMRNRRVFLYGGFQGNAAAQELWEYSAAGWRKLW